MAQAVFTLFLGPCGLPAWCFHHLHLIIPLAAPVFKVTVHSSFARLPQLSFCPSLFCLLFQYIFGSQILRFLDLEPVLNCLWIFFFSKMHVTKRALSHSVYIYVFLHLSKSPDTTPTAAQTRIKLLTTQLQQLRTVEVQQRCQGWAICAVLEQVVHRGDPGDRLG